MKKPEIPVNESVRLEALYKLNILDTPIQEGFERITRLTKTLFNVPIVAFSLVDAERQWFKSIQGLDVCETTREVSFCGHTINQDGLFVVKDTLLDERFADNPLVTNEPKIRFYAGYPVYSLDRNKIGTLCIIDTQPRSFTEQELLPLKDMAALIQTEISANKFYLDSFKLRQELTSVKKLSCIDGLTRVLNRSGIEELLNEKIRFSKEVQRNFGIALIDIDNFKKVNDNYGHCAGDEVLRQVIKRLLSGYRDTDTIGRWGGEEFLVIVDLKHNANLFDFADRARKLVASEPITFSGKSLKITVTTGVVHFDHENPVDISVLLRSADKALYKGKHNGKNVVVTGDLYVYDHISTLR